MAVAVRMYQFITVYFVSLAVKGKFGKTSKISKYYDHSCLQNFPLSFMFLLTVLDQTQKSCNTKFGPQEKIEKAVIMSDKFEHYFAT